jgi:hypothetical protein
MRVHSTVFPADSFRNYPSICCTGADMRIGSIGEKVKTGSCWNGGGKKTKTDEECRKQKKMMNKRRKNLKCIILSSQKIKSLRSSRAFNPPETKRKKLLLNHWDELFLVERFVLLFNSLPPHSRKVENKKFENLLKNSWKQNFFALVLQRFALIFDRKLTFSPLFFFCVYYIRMKIPVSFVIQSI